MKPEFFLSHSGVNIYHVYKYSEQLGFWYSTYGGNISKQKEEYHEGDFDVRKLPGAQTLDDCFEPAHHAAIITSAIEQGLVK